MVNVFGHCVIAKKSSTNRLSINHISIKKKKKIDGSSVHDYYSDHLAEW